MSAVRPMPETGSIFVDTRGGGRALRASWHSHDGVVVLSLWREGVCAATFRLDVEDVPAFVEMLTDGMAEAMSATRFREPHSA